MSEINELPGGEKPHLVVVAHPGWCGCGAWLAPGATAGYDERSRRVRCLGCLESSPASREDPSPTTPHPGTPGGSAWREYQRLSRQHETTLRERFPRAGVLLLALRSEPASARAWAVAASCAEQVGAVLSSVAGHGVYALHDRRIPGRRSSIDHIAVATNGVYVIHTQPHATRVEVRPPAQSCGLVERLVVAGRDRTDLLGALQRRVMAVHTALADLVDVPGLLVHPVLCLVHADLPVREPLTVDNMPVVGLRGISRAVRRPGPFDIATCERIHRHLAWRLPVMT